jgi:transposase
MSRLLTQTLWNALQGPIQIARPNRRRPSLDLRGDLEIILRHGRDGGSWTAAADGDARRGQRAYLLFYQWNRRGAWARLVEAAASDAALAPIMPWLRQPAPNAAPPGGRRRGRKPRAKT